MPFVPLACVALAFSIVVGSIRSGQRSKALAALAFALAIGFEGSRIALYLDPTVRGHFYYPMTYHVEILFRFLTVWTMTASCACMHHVMLSRDHRGMEIQSPT
jgi:hypothetical protein